MTRRRTNTQPLSKRRIDALEYAHDPKSKRSHYVADGLIERLYVRVYPSGKKTFVVRAYVGGKKRDERLGDFGPLTLQDARTLARARLLELDEGLEITRPRESGYSHVPTFNEFAERYFEQHADALRSAGHQRLLIRKYLGPRFGTMPLDRITLNDVLRMRTQLAKTPYQANRSMDLLKTILNRAIRWEVLPIGHVNPVTKVERFREAPRERVLTRDEVDRLLAAVDQIDSEHTQCLFRALLDLPLRKSEIMRATWAGFDPATATLRITSFAANKGVSAQALSNELVDAISALPRFDGNPYIFPNRDRTPHIKDIDSQWRRIKEAAGVSNARLHDLRRTIVTEYARLGATEYQIQATLGQRTNIAARHYVHLAQAEVGRELMERRRRARGL